MLDLPRILIDKTNAAVGTTIEDIGETGNTTPEVNLGGGYSRVAVQITNTGANALVNFALLGKTHPDATWENVIITTAWATVAERLLSFIGAPHILAASAVASALINVEGLHQIKFQADADTGGSGVTIKGMAVV
tara:strand:- start:4478 stop:4882 length:405 start_codon:yes stop_codon:yes gene_type:complete